MVYILARQLQHARGSVLYIAFSIFLCRVWPRASEHFLPWNFAHARSIHCRSGLLLVDRRPDQPPVAGSIERLMPHAATDVATIVPGRPRGAIDGAGDGRRGPGGGAPGDRELGARLRGVPAHAAQGVCQPPPLAAARPPAPGGAPRPRRRAPAHRRRLRPARPARARARRRATPAPVVPRRQQDLPGSIGFCVVIVRSVHPMHASLYASLDFRRLRARRCWPSSATCTRRCTARWTGCRTPSSPSPMRSRSK